MTQNKKPKLAIIIPVYKAIFFKQSLHSIANQTNKNFHVYIGDDASPHNIKDIVEPFKKNILITYQRFEQNLGSKSLTKQWERCIALSKNEPYIWLFSDDDLMPEDAVERFYKTIVSGNRNDFLYRFNLKAIDQNNKPLYTYKTKPEIETNYNFALNRLKGKYLSSVVEFIFKREIYIKNNGFVEFPHAWCSDDATWIRFAEGIGIYTIPGAPISWRISGSNVSSDSAYASKLVPVLYHYSGWLLNFFKLSVTTTFKNTVVLNIYRQTIQLGLKFGYAERKRTHRLFLEQFGNKGYFYATLALINLNLMLTKKQLIATIKLFLK